MSAKLDRETLGRIVFRHAPLEGHAAEAANAGEAVARYVIAHCVAVLRECAEEQASVGPWRNEAFVALMHGAADRLEKEMP